MPTSKSIHRTRLRVSGLAMWSALLALLLLGGCVRTAPPVQEMSDARQAVAAAREAGADRLAPQVFRRSLSLLGSAENTLARRRYKQARDQALASRRLAIEAMQKASTQARRDSP
ncbi:MAG: hypothetical protein AB8G16_13160 [Gammaproteobacteria bacterium]